MSDVFAFFVMVSHGSCWADDGGTWGMMVGRGPGSGSGYTTAVIMSSKHESLSLTIVCNEITCKLLYPRMCSHSITIVNIHRAFCQ